MISVVIPMYNSEATILDAIDSVLKQSRFDLIDEIIVVNDGSTDNSAKIVCDFKSNLPNNKIVLISKKNGGVSSARNIGIKKAKSKWIALLDADDVWKTEKIEIQMNILYKYQEIKFLGTNRNDEFVKIGTIINQNDQLRRINVKQMLIKVWPSVPTAIIDGKYLLNICGFDENMKFGEDANLWLKIALDNQLYYIENSLVDTGHGKNSFGETGLSSNLKQMHKGVNLNIKKAYQLKEINILEMVLFMIYEKIKYFRRIILTIWRKKNGD